MSEYLLVGGTWDQEQGKSSSIVNKIGADLACSTLNGGNFAWLQANFPSLIRGVKVLIWMPNVSNDEDKFLLDIKHINPHVLLISSKRVDGRDLADFDLVSRALKTHSNLLIKIDKLGDKFSFELMDPLGNRFCNTLDVSLLSKTMKERINTLLDMKRMGSRSFGERGEVSIPDEFIKLVRIYGESLTKYVNAVNTSRFLGNASTRCMSGFPSMRENPEHSNLYNPKVFVSRRNVDKEGISAKDFVQVESGVGEVVYFGKDKPSVDTPVQLRLYKNYWNINYMIHGHTYIDGFPMTESKIPCGYLNEYEEIVSLFPDRQIDSFCVNLRGHGFIVASENLKFIESVLGQMKSRPMLED